MEPSLRLTLERGRAIVRRAVQMASELHQRGAFVVVDDGGVVVTVSRVDGAGPTSAVVARAKAYVAAVNREQSARFVNRLSKGNPHLFAAYQAVLPKPIFPGPGATPIVSAGRVIGALSTGAGIGPSIAVPGVDPTRFLVDGKPANAEDLIICHALEVPYESQHGDDRQRWIDAYASPPPSCRAAPRNGPGAPELSMLTEAVRRSDLVLAEARERDVPVAVAVVDRHGDIVQWDRMDQAPPMAPDAARAKAATAVHFQRSSGEVAEMLERSRGVADLATIAGFPLLALPGGWPIERDGEIVGAVGVAAADPFAGEDLARAAAST